MNYQMIVVIYLEKNMLDKYTDRPDSHFQNGKYAILENLCFAEFLTYYYVES